MAIPNIQQNSRNKSTGIQNLFKADRIIFSDEFAGKEGFDGIDKDKWIVETILPVNEATATPDLENGNSFNASQWATNNYGIDRNGNPGNYPWAKRHSLWYDKHHSKTLKIVDGKLRMGGYVSNEKDPTTDNDQHPYFDEFEKMQADWTNKVYTGWLASFQPMSGSRINPAAPRHYWKFGFYEMEWDWSNQNTPGFRTSVWLMAVADALGDIDAYLNAKNYDGNSKSGAENDLFEYEPANNQGFGPDELPKNRLLTKIISSFGEFAGGTTTHAKKHGFDLTKGKHTLGIWWTPEFTRWYLNGIETTYDPIKLIHAAQGLIFSREGNSGIGQKGKKPNKPWLMNDPGLYGQNMGCYLDRINDDYSECSYIRVWQDPALDNHSDKNYRNFVSPYSKNAVDPATPKGDVAGEGTKGGIPGPISVCTGATSMKYIDGGTVDSGGSTPAISESSNNDAVESDFNLRVEGDTLVWDKTNADNLYDVKFGDNKYIASVKENKFSLKGRAEGTYFITGTPKNKDFKNSNKVEYPAPTKPAPSPSPVETIKPEPVQETKFNLRVEGRSLVWNDVNGEGSYDVKFGDNEYVASVKEPKFVLVSTAKEGEYFVTSTPKSKQFENSERVEFPRSSKPTPPVIVKVRPTPPPVVEKYGSGKIVDSESKTAITDGVAEAEGYLASLKQLLANLKKRVQ